MIERTRIITVQITAVKKAEYEQDFASTGTTKQFVEDTVRTVLPFADNVVVSLIQDFDIDKKEENKLV